ncbi:23223_t:CDS:2, partial [Gigaspora rosea]
KFYEWNKKDPYFDLRTNPTLQGHAYYLSSPMLIWPQSIGPSRLEVPAIWTKPSQSRQTHTPTSD